jgi:hypothetical protein
LQKDINSQTVADALKSYLFKVDEVANLKVVGLFEEQAIDKSGNPAVDENYNPVYAKLHVFGRTRNAPYFFYYRYFNIAEGNWYPWEKVQVDIPSYDLEDSSGKVLDNGTYLIPVLCNNRLLIFFPQFTKKTGSNSSTMETKFSDLGETTPDANKPTNYLELRLCWSEYRNNKWTQKQISTDAIYHEEPNPLQHIQQYQFVPRIFDNLDQKIAVDVCWIPDPREINQIGRFLFKGSQVSVEVTTMNEVDVYTNFHYTVFDTIFSFQSYDDEYPLLISGPPYFEDKNANVSLYHNEKSVDFNHIFIHQLLGK